jgi:hypothetical protein
MEVTAYFCDICGYKTDTCGFIGDDMGSLDYDGEENRMHICIECFKKYILPLKGKDR